MTMQSAIARWIQRRAFYVPFKDREYMVEAIAGIAMRSCTRTDVDHGQRKLST